MWEPRGHADMYGAIDIESILGTCFDVTVVARTRVQGAPAVILLVSGEAHWTGTGSCSWSPATLCATDSA